jgi:hypothetical protein
MFSGALRRSAITSKRLIKRGGDHHHELTVFTDGPPSKGRVLRWLGFLTMGPTSLTLGLYIFYVGPRIRAKRAEAAEAAAAAAAE